MLPLRFKSRFLRFTALPFVAFLLTGCNPTDQKNVTQDAQKFAVSSGEALTNATLAGKVNGVLSVWKGVDMSSLHVQAQDGVVTLEGHVRDAAEKKRVDFVTHQVRGVDKVVNHLTIQK